MKPKFPKKKGTFPKEQCTFPMERPKFPWTHVLIFFAIVIISCSFLYSLAAYHWKGFEKTYNFIVGNISIRIHMKKL
jgi:hypothetical protein